MNVLRPPVKTIAQQLADIYGSENVTIHRGFNGNHIQIKTPHFEVWAILGFNRRADKPGYDLCFYCRPSSQWKLDDTDVIRTPREILDADYSKLSTKQLVADVVKAIG